MTGKIAIFSSLTNLFHSRLFNLSASRGIRMMSGCRIAHQTVGFYSKVKFTSYSGASSNTNLRRRKRLIRRNSLGIAAERGKGTPMTAFPLFVSCLHSGSPGESPVLSNSSSQKEDDDELSLEGLSSVAGGIVALGKFDALHIGHRELAVQASKVGTPYLLSFVGMAEVLGWEPRAPVVAACDRKRVLSSWAPYCCDVIPQEIFMEFSTVRHLTPRQFVEKLAKEVGVGGIVAGENYRFGYRASGDTSDLLRLCDEYGIGAYIIGSVMDHNQKLENSFPKGTKERGQVSSTRVRYALAEGDVNYVRELLGRRHRVILSFENKETIICMGHDFSAPKSCLLNLPPKDGHYNACSLVIGNEISLPCKVTLDSKYFHLDFDRFGDFFHLTKSAQLAGIEFGSSEL